MPTQVVAPTAGGPPAEEPSRFWEYARNGIMMYLASQVTSRGVAYFMPPPAPRNGPGLVPPGYEKSEDGGLRKIVSETSEGATVAIPKANAVPIWPKDSSMSLHVYFSTSPSGDVDFDYSSPTGESFPHFAWNGLTYGDWNVNEIKDLSIPIPHHVQQNASSLWIDMFLTKDHQISPNPSDPSYDVQSVIHTRKLLTRYHPKKRIRKEKNLLSGSQANETEVEEEVEEKGPAPIVPYWSSNLTLALVQDLHEIPVHSMQPASTEHIHLERSGRLDENGRPLYYPILFPNDFWNLRDQMVEINTTTPVLPLQISLHAMSYLKFNLYSSVGASFEAQAAAGGGSGGEMDEIKRMLVETNPILLITTVLVSILHMVFEFLAFSSDVSHWRKKDKDQDMTGISLRTIISNCVVQLVILLYLQDNNADTSWMILLGQGMGLLVELYKITKIIDFKLLPNEHPTIWTLYLPYYLAFEDKKKNLSEDELKSQEYDALAFRLVSYGAIPLLVGYTLYSLMYESHRSWYSFVISTSAQAIYMFGFVQLIPQLIINYKLKSVAHMPMKAMVYKTLSTVVDDFFSFVIKMPFLHRLACFRDDVVFIILLYQRWIYRVDKKRVNEYGQVAIESDLQDPSEDAGEEPTEPLRDVVAGEKREKKVKETKKTK